MPIEANFSDKRHTPQSCEAMLVSFFFKEIRNPIDLIGCKI